MFDTAPLSDEVPATVPGRIPAPCSHFGLCGGCRYQDIPYEEQLRMKHASLVEELKRSGISDLFVADVLPAPDVYFYRNKMEFAFGLAREGGLVLGLHPRRRYDQVFDLGMCHLQSPASSEVVRVVRESAVEMGWSVYDLKRHTGVLRFLTIRDAKSTGEIMVNLVVGDLPDSGFDSLADRLFEKIPGLTSVLLSVHGGKAQIARGEGVLARGTPAIHERLCGLTFEISPYAFFQTNTRQAERLYEVVADFSALGDGDDLLDLYSGTGAIALVLSRRARSATGIEISEESVERARLNAKANGIANATFISGDVAAVLSGLLSDGRRPDVVVTDPPRAGMGKKGVELLLRAGARRITYVSCNPVSLASDLGRLRSAGYMIGRVQPVDMFPHTPHCETVVELAIAAPGRA